MTVTPEQELRMVKAMAVFDAKRRLLAEAWGVESLRYLTWAFDVQPAEPNADRGVTVVAHFEDTRARGRAASESRKTKRAEGGRVVTNPPPMPSDPDQYWATVTLQSGGKLTLSVSGNPLNLRGDDRTVIDDIIDRLTEYRDQAAR